VKSSYKKEILNHGQIDVALYQDKVCIDNSENCMPSFQFQTQKDGIGLSQTIGGLIGIGPGGAANILEQLYDDGSIGAKTYAFYNPIHGGVYDMACRIGAFNPKLIKPETTQVMDVVGTDQWMFRVDSLSTNGKDVLPRKVKYANLSFGGGYTAMPQDMYTGFCQQVYGAAPAFRDSKTTCKKEIVGECPANLPTFTLKAGSASIALEPDYYTDEYKTQGGETRCALLLINQLVTYTPDQFTLSSALLRKRVLVLNQETMTMELSEENDVTPPPGPPTPTPPSHHGLSFGSWVIIFIVLALVIGGLIAAYIYVKKRRDQKNRYNEQADLARERAETEASQRETLVEERPDGAIN